MTAIGGSTGPHGISKRGLLGTVTFDVRGQHIKVLPELFARQPDTLLPQLVDDVGTNSTEPIFVDANPERFAHILDWYRYGRMFLHSGVSAEALLHDAAFFLLPDTVIVDGVERQVLRSNGDNQEGVIESALPDVGAGRLQQQWETGMLKRWPEFDDVLRSTVEEIEEQLYDVVHMSGQEMVQHRDSYGRLRDFDALEAGATIQVVWEQQDAGGICCRERLRLLLMRLEAAGYNYHVHETSYGYVDLRITIPSDAARARGQCVQRPMQVKVLDPKSGRWQLPEARF
eukprot:TRINITY_DN4363_c1_g1_i1.p1 TRINITY_DN4363_c1_g1~~TRINITY_DN4363_c1_g1_i1.p1  ORF type:complete len:286 (-),score=33.65 TRINITY_DN4363_c1_g1_i1:92-949(-)